MILIDGNNYFRRQIETCPYGQNVARRIFYAAFRSEGAIWCWDSPTGNARRKAVFPGYKEGRPPLNPDVFRGMQFVKQLLALTPQHQITVEGYEADDVIAALAARFRKAGVMPTILSTDWDLAATGCPVPDAKAKDAVTPPWIRLYKTLVGDKTDRIPGIRGFALPAWEATRPDHPRLQLAIATGDRDFLEAYDWPPRGRPKDLDELFALWEITGFYPVPDDVLNASLVPGRPDAAAGEQLLKENLL